jgi:hypothetical protein
MFLGAALSLLGLFQAGSVLGQVDPATEADHALIIRGLDHESYERGRKLYEATCITCHGNLTQPGSLPTSRPFWLEPFKNGSDPFSLYKTITTGFGQMPAWPWLTPELRYDVIHYLREAFVKPHNPAAYFAVTEAYLAGLPKGQSFVRSRATEEYESGPKWKRMQFGPVLFWTLEVAPGNIAQKGISIRLDPGAGGISRGNVWMVYDHDTLRAAAAWSGDEFVDWSGIAFDGSHGTHTRIVGERLFVNPVGPGWARPGTRDFADNRPLDKEGRPYGPLARDWTHYRGTYVNGDRVVIDYTVGGVRVLESPGLEQSAQPLVIRRMFQIAPRDRDLLVRLAPADTLVALASGSPGELRLEAGFHVLRVPPGAEEARITVLLARRENDSSGDALSALAKKDLGAPDLRSWTQGGPARWSGEIPVAGKTQDDGGPFAVDVIPVPNMGDNPWNAWMRPGGFDFFPDGQTAALCTWNGDVWLVKGVDGDLRNVRWRRIAAGLFQPLGLKIVDSVIHVACRDQIAQLRDLNGDDEIDWIRNFNNDHQVTEHFHEFAMGLQTDVAGNFYYSKGARHAKTDLIPHHGTLLKVSRDGATTEILANGFRAPNGVCVNPDGTFFVTDQEGHWTPKNRINRIRPGQFYGNMWSYGAPASESDDAMEEPLVWVTNDMDRSPGELLWVTSDAWGPLKGSLLNLSYGTGDIFIVPHETVNGRRQGGVVRLPLERFPTGVMRGRWHPVNGQLYAAGMFAWAGNQQDDGGFYRVRLTGRPLNLPTALQARRGAYAITFTEPLDRATATDLGSYTVKAWDLLRSKNYGSKHVNERPWGVTSAALSGDGKTVTLTLPDLAPTRGMEIVCRLRGANGKEFERRIHSTLHELGEGLGETAAARNEETLGRFVRLALDCVHREYPNKIAHVLQGDADVKPPRELTPAFYGCFDWHSAVHGHWLIARGARLYPDAPWAAEARAALARSLTPERLAAEAQYLAGPGRASFERPYGLAWLLQLGAELRQWESAEARAWSAALRPLEEEAVRRVGAWLPKLSHPVRSGEHSQTAFALGLMLDWARVSGNEAFGRLLAVRARKFYSQDKNAPLAFEPSGEDFLSPVLAEADLMRRVMEPAEFAQWLDGFLPGLPRDAGVDWLKLAVSSDRSDGKLAHLDGLNLSRAWMLEGVVSALPASDARRASLKAAAEAHRAAGLNAIGTAHYEGTHWLGSFAMYLVSGRGLR